MYSTISDNMSNNNSKGSYEAIPDVEAGVAAAATTSTGHHHPSTKSREAVRATHPGLKDREVDLLATLDEAVANKPSFAVPAVDPHALESKGKTFLVSLLQPTVTVVCSTLVSWLLALTAQSEMGLASLATFLIPFYPYLNAIAVFVSSYFPLAGRFTDAVSPVLDQMGSTVQKAERNVDALGDRVDQIIESIQVQVNEVMEPYKPMFARAVQAETALRKINPDIDIPDPDDINREFDEAQGIVGAKLDQAKEKINVEKVIPVPLRSKQSFYWRIVVPVAVVAFLFQLILVAVAPKPASSSDNPLAKGLQNLNETIQSQSSDWNATINKHGNLRGLAHANLASRMVVQKSELINDSSFEDATDALNNATTEYHDAFNHKMSDTTNSLHNASDEMHNQVANAKESLHNTTAQYKDELHNQVASAQAAKDAALANASHWWHDAQSNATNTVHQFEDKAKSFVHDVEANATALEDNLRDEFENQKSQFLDMLPSILLSYAMALLQLGFTYLVSSAKVKTWLVNRSLNMASNRVRSTLDEYGVTDAIDDVLGVRLPRIKTKVERALEAAQQLDGMLGKLGGVEQLGKAADKVGKFADKFGFGKK